MNISVGILFNNNKYRQKGRVQETPSFLNDEMVLVLHTVTVREREREGFFNLTMVPLLHMFNGLDFNHGVRHINSCMGTWKSQTSLIMSINASVSEQFYIFLSFFFYLPMCLCIYIEYNCMCIYICFLFWKLVGTTIQLCRKTTVHWSPYFGLFFLCHIIRYMHLLYIRIIIKSFAFWLISRNYNMVHEFY